MRSRRASRLIAALAAAFIAAAGVTASMWPRFAAAAQDCCKKRCHHQSGKAESLASCCCAAPATPSATVGASAAKPLASCVWTLAVAQPPTPAALPHAPCAFRAHAPPGPPLYLQRCTLVL